MVGPVDRDDGDSDKVIDIHWIDDSIIDSWKRLKCHRYDARTKKIGDFPCVTNYFKVPMFSERAWSVLKPIIGDACEVLPVDHPFDGNYYIIHVMRTIDAIDVDASEVWRSSSGRIGRIYKYALKYELLDGKHIFKLPLQCGSGLYVDDVFRQAVEKNGLKGLIFKELRMKEA